MFRIQSTHKRVHHEERAIATFLIGLAVASTPGPLQGQQFEYAKQAEFDEKRNIYVSSDQGKLIWVGDTKHCSEARVANDQQTVGCRAMQGQEHSNSLPSLQLEIYRKGGHKEIIQPGALILEWHFWKDGKEIAVYYGAQFTREHMVCTIQQPLA